MKQEEFMESIYGCLERIENKINGLSMPQSAGGDAEADKEVIQELNALKTGFKRVLEALGHDQRAIHPSAEKKLHAGQVHGNPVCIEKRTAMAYHKNQNEFLERFAQTEKDTILHISEKMESLSTSVRNRMEEPDVVCHRHSISIDTPYIFWTLILLVTYSIVVSVAFYIEKWPDNDRMDNDLKYRYIKMKGEATPNEISELENIFELNRDNAGIEQIREDVEVYEDAVRKQAALTEQVRLKEQAAKELDSKAKSIKSKSIGNESKNSLWPV